MPRFARSGTRARDPHVTATLLRGLHELALGVPPVERGRAVQEQIADIRFRVETSSCSPRDKGLLLERASEVEETLQTHTLHNKGATGAAPTFVDEP